MLATNPRVHFLFNFDSDNTSLYGFDLHFSHVSLIKHPFHVLLAIYLIFRELSVQIFIHLNQVEFIVVEAMKSSL